MDLKFEEKREIGRARKIVLSGCAGITVRRGSVPAMLVQGSTSEAVSSVRTELKGSILEISLDEASISCSAGHITMVNSAPGVVQIGMVAGGSAQVQIFHGKTGAVRVIRGDASQTFYAGRWSDFTVASDSPQGAEEPATIIHVEITLPELDELSVSGAANATLVDLVQERLSVEVAGAGRVEATGKVENIRVDVSGAGNVKLRDLAARNGRLQVSGAGSLKATVQSDVKAGVSGFTD